MRINDNAALDWYLQLPGLTDLLPLMLDQRLARGGSHQIDSSDEDVSVSSDEDVSVYSWADTAGGGDNDSTGPADDDAPGVVPASSDTTGPSILGGTGTPAARYACRSSRFTAAVALQLCKISLSMSLSSNRRRAMATLK